MAGQNIANGFASSREIHKKFENFKLRKKRKVQIHLERQEKYFNLFLTTSTVCLFGCFGNMCTVH